MTWINSLESNNTVGQLNIVIGNTVLEILTCAKNLGLLLDNKLRFVRHINFLISRSFCNLNAIYMLCTSLFKFETKILIYICGDVMVLYMFNFSDSVFGPCLNYEGSRRIQMIQNACVRLIYGIDRRDHITHKGIVIPCWTWQTEENFILFAYFTK